VRNSHYPDAKDCRVQIEKAQPRDYDDILELQERYYIANLPPEKRRDGFLSAGFTLSQITAMAQDLGIVVARTECKTVAYMCASRIELTPRPPILDALFKSLEGATFRGKPLSEARIFVYGPVCIDEKCRGAGLLKRMFDRFKVSLADDFDVGVAFIAADNPRSLAAHVRGLLMDKLALFEYDGKGYHAIVFPVT
jgi:hypothetical protein